MSKYHPLKIRSKKPRKVYLYGDSPSLAQYRELLNKADIEIAGIIGSSIYPDIQSVDKKTIFLQPEIPIIITSGTFHCIPPDLSTRERFNFFSKTISALIAEGCPNQILHPCFVTQFLEISLNNSAFVTGLPGSGNILLQRIALTLIERNLDQESDVNVFIKNMCQNFDHQLLVFVTELLNKQGATRIVETSYGLGFTNFSIHLSDFLVNVCDVRSYRHYYRKLYGTHHLIDRNTADEIQRLKMPIFICLRHPVDTHISWWNKVVNDERNYTKREIPDLNDKNILNDVNWSAYFYKTSIDACNNFLLIRFEDMLAKPDVSIRLIAKHLNFVISENKARALWAEFGMKPLPGTDKGHFHSPSLNKWESTLDEVTKSNLERSKVLKFFEPLGYSLNGLTSFNLDEFKKNKLPFSDAPFLNRDELMFNEKIDDTIWIECPHGHNSKAKDVRQVLDTDLFKSLCSSADYQ